MECCNRECATAFCPHCGTQVASAACGVDGLLRHLESQIKSQQTGIDNTQRRIEGRAGVGCQRARDILAKRKRAQNKWQMWHDAVTALVEKAESKVAVGHKGKVTSQLRPAGKAVFDGIMVDVVTQAEYLEIGTDVEIINIKGNRVIVIQTKTDNIA